MGHRLWTTKKLFCSLKLGNISELFKGNFIVELLFFIMLLMYALFGPTYNRKNLDYIMLASWFNYFLLTFRSEFKLYCKVKRTRTDKIFKISDQIGPIGPRIWWFMSPFKCYKIKVEGFLLMYLTPTSTVSLTIRASVSCF